MQTLWKDIPGYEGYYQVSSSGHVRSVDRIVELVGNPRVKRQFVAGRVLKVDVGANKHCLVTLCKRNKTRHFLLHRLVAKAFMPNVDNKPFINHKDNNPRNNAIDNLEWCTAKENSAHAAKLGVLGAPKKPVAQLTQQGVLVRQWDSATDAAMYMGNLNMKSCISECCRGDRPHYKGFRWEFV